MHSYLRSRAVLRAGSLFFLPFLLNAATANEPAPQVASSYGKLPLSFEKNSGQTDSRVKFLARGSGYSLFLTRDSAVLALRGKTKGAALRMKLVGANRNPEIAGTDALPGKSNYFIGKDPSQWRTNVPTYAKVKYRGVYPGIDLIYYGNQRLLEYDFLVAPGADPRAIELRFQSAKKLSVNSQGALVLDVGGGEVIEHAPAVYQEVAGQRRTVAGRYVLRGKGRVGFRVAEYDRTEPLVIDPTLAYSTYLGGNGDDRATGIAVDAAGNAYITGWAWYPGYPVTPGAFQTTGLGGAFVSKLNSSGTALVYSTYVSSDSGYASLAYGIAVDTSGNTYVTGLVGPGFPTTNGAFQTSCKGQECAFVSKLNATGSGLIYSTYLGGTSGAWGTAIAVDVAGDAYVTGAAQAPFDFPTTPGAFRPTVAGTDTGAGFVSKLNPAGSALVYSTYLAVESRAAGIAVDSSGNAYIAGGTESSDFPTTAGAFQTALRGGSSDAFVTKLNATGSALVYSTYLGGTSADGVSGIAVDVSGNAYVAGSTHSADFPTTLGALRTSGGYGDGFVTKLNSSGSALVYSTYLHGASGIAVDRWGQACVTGATGAADFPTTPDAFQSTLSGFADAFASKLNSSGTALVYSTYFGGNDTDSGTAIAVDSAGDIYITGVTVSSIFPTTPAAFQVVLGGGSDVFVSKLSLGASAGPVTTATISGLLGLNSWYIGAVTVSLSANPQGSSVVATYYSVDGTAYQKYVGPFAVSSDGTHQLWLYSVDALGRQESPHRQTFGIDTTKPSSSASVPSFPYLYIDFNVSWDGRDATSGVLDFTIYVSDNTGPYTPWLTNTTATHAVFFGTMQHRYDFFSIARDRAGNQENLKANPDASALISSNFAGDLNGDGRIDCGDIALIKAALGKRAGQTGFDPRADLNGEGVIDVRDLAIEAKRLPGGTQCP